MTQSQTLNKQWSFIRRGLTSLLRVYPVSWWTGLGRPSWRAARKRHRESDWCRSWRRPARGWQSEMQMMIEMFTLNAAKTNSTSLSFTFKHSGKLCPYFKFHKTNYQLDSGSIKTSPRDGLRAIGKETTPNCTTLGYFGLFWATLGYSGLLWATLD